MTEPIAEAALGLMEVIWLMLFTGVLIIATPLWILPYTAHKIWKQLKKKNT